MLQGSNFVRQFITTLEEHDVICQTFRRRLRGIQPKDISTTARFACLRMSAYSIAFRSFGAWAGDWRMADAMYKVGAR